MRNTRLKENTSQNYYVVRYDEIVYGIFDSEELANNAIPQFSQKLGYKNAENSIKIEIYPRNRIFNSPFNNSPFRS